jgi:SulP family sulfate permease
VLRQTSTEHAVIPYLNRACPPTSRCFDWGRDYDRDTLTNDMVAAVIVTIMLIPQSLAYALLAGLPPKWVSTPRSRRSSLCDLRHQPGAGGGPGRGGLADDRGSVGPHRRAGSPELLPPPSRWPSCRAAFLLPGVLRLGFLANFLSHPVIAGFITASGILIAMSQLRMSSASVRRRHNLYETAGLAVRASQANWITLGIGVATAFLFWVRKGLKPLLSTGMNPSWPISRQGRAGGCGRRHNAWSAWGLDGRRA